MADRGPKAGTKYNTKRPANGHNTYPQNHINPQQSAVRSFLNHFLPVKNDLDVQLETARACDLFDIPTITTLFGRQIHLEAASLLIERAATYEDISGGNDLIAQTWKNLQAHRGDLGLQKQAAQLCEPRNTPDLAKAFDHQLHPKAAIELLKADRESGFAITALRYLPPQIRKNLDVQMAAVQLNNPWGMPYLVSEMQQDLHVETVIAALQKAHRTRPHPLNNTISFPLVVRTLEAFDDFNRLRWNTIINPEHHLQNPAIQKVAAELCHPKDTVKLARSNFGMNPDPKAAIALLKTASQWPEDYNVLNTFQGFSESAKQDPAIIDAALLYLDNHGRRIVLKENTQASVIINFLILSTQALGAAPDIAFGSKPHPRPAPSKTILKNRG